MAVDLIYTGRASNQLWAFELGGVLTVTALLLSSARQPRSPP